MNEDGSPRLRSAAELRAEFDGSFALPEPGQAKGLRTLLVLGLGETQYRVALEQVASVHVDLRFAQVPARARSLLGLATVRNAIVPVHDPAVVLGLRAAPAAGRWAVLARAEPLIAWTFDRMDGQIRVDPAEAVAGLLDLEELRHDA